MTSSAGTWAAPAPAAANPWFSWSYLQENTDTILAAGREHFSLTVQTIAFGLLIALPLAVLASRVRWLAGPIVGATGVLYTIPSLSLFALVAPFTGLTTTTVLVGLVVYALLILVRNILTGLREVPEAVRDAARGMGYGPLRMLVRVELPIALPSIMTGVRVATVSTIALVTVGVIVGTGGFGSIIVGGLNANFYRAQIMTGTLLCVLFALVADLGLAGLTRLLVPWSRRRAA
ncbi:MAG TPA: ABC transporter permease [Cryptosporangiaceae bacterium]|nr:ABC transporter permease [Cryptosporangiaceae bacterium]